jgi:transposase-like protein
MEIITGVERRRRWRIEDKLRIVAEAEAPGAIISHVARRHHISRGLLSNWRQQVRCGALLAGDYAPVFMPVQMMPEAMATSCSVPMTREPSAVAGAVAEDRRIEIALPDGTCIRVGADVGLAVLRRVMAAVHR